MTIDPSPPAPHRHADTIELLRSRQREVTSDRERMEILAQSRAAQSVDFAEDARQLAVTERQLQKSIDALLADT